MTQREINDTIYIAIEEIPLMLAFNDTELSYIERFNSIDYFQLYDITSDINGYINIRESLERGIVAFGGYKYRIEFHFTFDQDNYVLGEISYREY
ncbi:MAG: hypothetical protein EP338_07835 [Bacteroidetes bacterium]|nr:MAG: hypothetical protein EP338_07835 [Bacteroidota bacterium]